MVHCVHASQVKVKLRDTCYNVLSRGMRMWVQVSFVDASDRRTDGQTDISLMAKTALHR